MPATARYLSPLRYPGGKARMACHLTEMLHEQWSRMDLEIWLEPFAGGAGAGLAQLAREEVSEVWLVEKNPALAAFWRVCADPHGGAELAARVVATCPTMGLWEWSRALVAEAVAPEPTDTAGPSGTAWVDEVELAYAAFMVNRCSRSGIVDARVGPLGGKAQTRYTVASRFNAPALAARIREVTRLAHGGRLRVFEADAIAHLTELNGTAGVEDELFVFVDPPYIAEGNGLYAHGMTPAQHLALAEALHECPCHWLLTYDDHPQVLQLYPSHRVLAFEIAHSANTSRIDWEYAVFSDSMNTAELPQLLPTGTSRWVANSPQAVKV